METRSLDTPLDLCSRNSEFALPNSQNGTPRTFKRGHIRRSSYESQEIHLNFPRRHDPRPPLVNRASFEEALSSLHLAAEEERADCSLSCASTDTGQTPDSALGDSVSSKRSSLDRRSDASVADWEDQKEGSGESLDGSKDQVRSRSPADPLSSPACLQSTQSRRLINIPSINFPKGFFSRGKQSSGGSWRLPFGKMKESSGVVHTTGLILEERPSSLPAKPEAEATRHRALHQELIDHAKKREAKAGKERKRQLLVQQRLEEQAMSANRLWNESILPKWEEMRSTKRCRELWWQGVPSSVRGRVWSLAILNELNITHELYDVVCKRALQKLAGCSGTNSESDTTPISESTCSREDSVAQVELDVSRTFPALGIFQKGGPYNKSLQLLLAAYVCYRPDVGYVQSMSFLAAVLLLQMEPFPAFVAFANLLNGPLQVAFFRLQQPEMTEYFIAFDRYFEQELPELHARFDEIDVRPDIYLIEWVYTLFAKSLPFDVTCRVWDVFIRDGEEFVFKAALGILRMHEKQLISMEFDDVVHFLTHLPDSLCGAELFRNIEPFMRNYPCNSETARSKKRFLQILADVKERINGSSCRHEATVASAVAAASQCDPSSSSPQLSAINSSLQTLKMSKSLSGFIGDLLKSSNE